MNYLNLTWAYKKSLGFSISGKITVSHVQFLSYIFNIKRKTQLNGCFSRFKSKYDMRLASWHYSSILKYHKRKETFIYSSHQNNLSFNCQHYFKDILKTCMLPQGYIWRSIPGQLGNKSGAFCITQAQTSQLGCQQVCCSTGSIVSSGPDPEGSMRRQGSYRMLRSACLYWEHYKLEQWEWELSQGAPWGVG